MVSMQNEYIQVSFASKGAELKSLRSVPENLEYMWSGDPQFWGKTSPVLFPVVGALKDDTYYFEGKAYKLPRHGFARDMEFSLAEQSDKHVLWVLNSSPQTLEVYPFEFSLGLRYEISGPSLTCTYEVLNTGKQPLWFSVGGHPAFAAPLLKEGNYTDCFLQFNKDSSLLYHTIKNNLIANETRELTLEGGKLPLQHALFYEDALVFKNLKSDCISLCNTLSGHGLNFRFAGFPYFGIWAAKDADFVCLEPWCGIADGTGHNQELKDKEGMVELQAGREWKRSWTAEIISVKKPGRHAWGSF